jgi:hypothetical protein
MANIPHTTTRSVARKIGAAPAFAPKAPRAAKVTTVTTRTTGMIEPAGAANAASNGIAAAMLKVKPDVKAA